jgi:hypothetical protein
MWMKEAEGALSRPKPSIPGKILTGIGLEKLENLRYFQAY